MPQLRHLVPPLLPTPARRRAFFSLTQRNDESGDRSSLGLPPVPTIFFYCRFEGTGAPLLRESVTLSLLRLVVPLDRVPPPPGIANQIDLIVSKFILKYVNRERLLLWIQRRRRAALEEGSRGSFDFHE